MAKRPNGVDGQREHERHGLAEVNAVARGRLEVTHGDAGAVSLDAQNSFEAALTMREVQGRVASRVVGDGLSVQASTNQCANSITIGAALGAWGARQIEANRGG